ncbi:MAG TPA: helix-turn-helix transcriptional regulator [Anaerolineaceae bacterium]|nr:helix-turn-helix transcriptional regulator [Anaerolineaceae bacterium]
MALPIAKARRLTRQKDFDPMPLINRLRELLAATKDSYREASLKAGLDHQAVRRILEGQRPAMHICILLADYFNINPNELLFLADWPPLRAFEIYEPRAEHLPPEALEVALDIAKIPDADTRRQVADAIRILLKKYFA